MDTKQLKKLKRSELLGMLLQRSRELERVQAELDAERAAHAETRKRLDSQRIAIEESGSIAEATVRISGIMEEAQSAADQYLQRVREQAEEETASLKIAKKALARKQELLDALQGKLDKQLLDLNREKKELEASRKSLEAERAALVKEKESWDTERAAPASEKESWMVDRTAPASEGKELAAEQAVAALAAGNNSEELAEKQNSAATQQDAEA